MTLTAPCARTKIQRNSAGPSREIRERCPYFAIIPRQTGLQRTHRVFGTLPRGENSPQVKECNGDLSPRTCLRQSSTPRPSTCCIVRLQLNDVISAGGHRVARTVAEGCVGCGGLDLLRSSLSHDYVCEASACDGYDVQRVRHPWHLFALCVS